MAMNSNGTLLLRMGRRRGDDDLDPLELLQLRVARGRHRALERAHQVHRAVRNGRRAEQDLLKRPDRVDLDPRATRQLWVVGLAAPVVAAAWRLGRAGERRADHDRVRAEGE